MTRCPECFDTVWDVCVVVGDFTVFLGESREAEAGAVDLVGVLGLCLSDVATCCCFRAEETEEEWE